MHADSGGEGPLRVAGVMLISTSSSSFRLAPELTALPLSVTVDEPLPLVEIVSAKPLC